MRSFEQSESHSYLLVRIIPYANAQDAEAELKDARRFITTKPRRGIVMGEETPIVGFTLPELSNSWAFEQYSIQPDTSAYGKVVAGVVGNVLLIMAFTGETEYWTWPAIAVVAELQAKRIRDHAN